MIDFVKTHLVAAAALAALLSSPRARADTIRIDTLKCLQPKERHGFDRIRLRYRVDGGRTQELRRKLRYDEVWNVGTEVSFDREARIEVLEHDLTPFLKDKTIISVTILAGSVADGQAVTFARNRHGGHYWMSVGRGDYVAPTPPESDPARPRPLHWEDGGTYATPDAASAAGHQLLTTGVATKFEVLPTADWGTATRVWWLKYLPKD